MPVYLILLFLTFVLSAVPGRAAPSTRTTVSPSPYQIDPDVKLTSVPEELRDFQPRMYLQLAAGFSGGNYRERDEYLQGPFISLRYMPLEKEQIVWDYQLEFAPENTLGVALGRRWYCCPPDRFMPYARASANLFLTAKDELAGVAEARRWRLRTAVGIGRRFTSEFGVGLAVTGPDIYAQFGYNFAF